MQIPVNEDEMGKKKMSIEEVLRTAVAKMSQWGCKMVVDNDLQVAIVTMDNETVEVSLKDGNVEYENESVALAMMISKWLSAPAPAPMPGKVAKPAKIAKVKTTVEVAEEIPVQPVTPVVKVEPVVKNDEQQVVKKTEEVETMASVYDRMDEEGQKGGMYLKMINTPEHPVDEKFITVLKDAVEATYELAAQFVPAEKRNDPAYNRERTEFNMAVRDDVTGNDLMWSIRRKDVEIQMSAIVKRFKLTSLVGKKLKIQTHGIDPKKTVWMVLYSTANDGMT
jgi:hypothetical protein